MRSLIVSGAMLVACAAAVAQEATVTIDRGLTEDRPYTLIYPDILKSIDDGSPITIATLQHPEAPLQCDAMIADGASAGWTAEAAVAALDVAGTEQGWVTDFPGFAITNTVLTAFQSGPALMYEGESTDSPLGLPLHIVHAEAVDGGRTYVLECLVEKSVAEGAKPLIDFLIANFSTKSDGECCVDPTGNQ
jgi:hypothetical protein